MRYLFILIATIGLGIFSSCKKENSTPPPVATTNPTAPSLSVNDKQKDTALLISRELYLWYKQIPASFDAKSYSDLNALMIAIRQYSQEAGYSQPVDRWSFAVKQSEWNAISSGVAGDFGLNVFFKEPGDLRVRLVEPASPAGRAGVRRGWRITKINGSTDINSANAKSIVDNVYNSSSTSFTFQKPDNSTVDLTLNAATYQEKPNYLDTVYTINGKSIGYMVFNSFLGDSAAIDRDFRRTFNRFTSQDVSDVIVDLRYNGGGYLYNQEKLSNYLAPVAANGNLMAKREYNDKLSKYTSAINFRKLGSLNLNRVFFIVSSNTASASESLINSLKPYMDVKLVGSSKTYGKPVGYFPYPIGDFYIFPVSSRSVNKNGEANYYNGFEVNNKVADGLDKDWGDVSESLLASTLSFITTGSYRLRGTEVYVEKPAVIESNEILSRDEFKGAIERINR